MIMLQTGSGGDGGGSLNWGATQILGAFRSGATTFRNTPWIQRLNAMLQRELAAVATWRTAPELETACVATIIARHQEAARDLVRLVVSHRGLPVDRTSAFGGRMTRAVLQISSAIGTGVAFRRRLAARRLCNLEQGLARGYAELLADAPAGDAEVLAHLQHLTATTIDELRSRSAATLETATGSAATNAKSDRPY